MARAQLSPVRTTTAPVHRGGIGGWIVALIVAIILALAAYFVVAGSGTRYNAPAAPAPATAAPASAAPATGAPGNVPAPQMTAAPAAPRYP